jgi:hypothetical protein
VLLVLGQRGRWIPGSCSPRVATCSRVCIQDYLYQLDWPTTTWTAEADNITFYYIKASGKHKRLFLVTPQARIIANLAMWVKSCWALRALGHNEPIAYHIFKLEKEEGCLAMEAAMERKRQLEEELARQQRRARGHVSKGAAPAYSSVEQLHHPAGGPLDAHLVHGNSLGNIRARERGGSQREGLSRSGSLRSMEGGSSRNSILDLNKVAHGAGGSGAGGGGAGDTGSLDSEESSLKEEEYMAKVRNRHSTVLLTKGPKKSMSQIYKSLTTSTAKRISKASFDYDQFLTVAGPADVVDMREHRPEQEEKTLPSKRY